MKEKEYRITEASLEKLNQTIEEELAGLGTLSRRLKKIFATLCVPVPEVEGWVNNPEADCTGDIRLTKRGYQLVDYGCHMGWHLYPLGGRNNRTCIASLAYKIKPFSISEAQARADKIIEEREKGEESAKMTCPNCEGRGTVWKTSPGKKPFGPGTRLVAPNGDEVVFLKDDFNVFYVGNITQGTFVTFYNARARAYTNEDLQSALTAAGYRVKDDAER